MLKFSLVPSVVNPKNNFILSMKESVLMIQLPIVISPVICVLILYLFNRKFNYKRRLIGVLGDASTYKGLLIIIYIIIFHLIIDKSFFLHPLGTTMFALS